MPCPQGMPPWRGETTTERARNWEPPEQDLVQGEKLPHLDQTQSTGQLKPLQLAVALVAPQAAAPHLAATSTVRVLVFLPAPHDLVQEP